MRSEKHPWGVFHGNLPAQRIRVVSRPSLAVIQPFRGVRFDAQRGGPPGNVVCRTYDVVDEEHVKQLVARSPWNLIRVELPQEKPRQPASAADYERAAKALGTWEMEGGLVPDPKPVLYP